MLSGRWGCCGPGSLTSRSSLFNLSWRLLHSLRTRLNLFSPGKVKHGITQANPVIGKTKGTYTRLKPSFFEEGFLKFVTSPASQVFKSSRFANFRRGPLFLMSLVGVYYSSDEEWTAEHGMVSKSQMFEVVAQDVRHTVELFEAMTKKAKGPSATVEEVSRVRSVDELVLGKAIAKGCSAVVYPADIKGKQSAVGSGQFGKHPYAVKIMFNYSVVSHAPAILKSMFRETVPAQNIHVGQHLSEWEYSELISRPLLTPHPNIVSLYHVFVDQVPALPDALNLYPDALPPRINPAGLGRNMSLFLVMKRYDCSLREYLRKGRPSNATSLMMLTQILEGVAYLVSKRISHRDIKSDNILLDLSHDPLKPSVVITDFGCCLADKERGLSVPFLTWDTEKGGNAALMAPEVACARPGTFSTLNYQKYDAWAVGAIAYEIFGQENPFYATGSNRLDSRSYKNEELPAVGSDVPREVQGIIFGLLDRNPDTRLSAKDAATLCQMLLWGPKTWFDPSMPRPSENEISKWLLALANKVIAMPNWLEADPQFGLVITFLKRARIRDCILAIDFLRSV